MTRAIYAVNKGLHYVAGALIIGVVVITVYNILGRWLFDAPLRGAVELTEIAMVGIVYLGMAFAQHRDSHISVDLLYQHLGPRWRAALDVFAAVVGVAVVALLAWRVYVFAGVLDADGRETASRRIPLYPIAYLAVVAMVAYGLALVSTLVKRLRDGFGKEPPPEETEPIERTAL